MPPLSKRCPLMSKRFPQRPQFLLYLSQIAKCICLKFQNVFVSCPLMSKRFPQRPQFLSFSAQKGTWWLPQVLGHQIQEISCGFLQVRTLQDWPPFTYFMSALAKKITFHAPFTYFMSALAKKNYLSCTADKKVLLFCLLYFKIRGRLWIGHILIRKVNGCRGCSLHKENFR